MVDLRSENKQTCFAILAGSWLISTWNHLWMVNTVNMTPLVTLIAQETFFPLKASFVLLNSLKRCTSISKMSSASVQCHNSCYKLVQEALKRHPDGCDCSQGRLRNHLLPNKTPWWPFESTAPLWTVCNESSHAEKHSSWNGIFLGGHSIAG